MGLHPSARYCSPFIFRTIRNKNEHYIMIRGTGTRYVYAWYIKHCIFKMGDSPIVCSNDDLANTTRIIEDVWGQEAGWFSWLAHEALGGARGLCPHPTRERYVRAPRTLAPVAKVPRLVAVRRVAYYSNTTCNSCTSVLLTSSSWNRSRLFLYQWTGGFHNPSYLWLIAMYALDHLQQ